MKRLVRVSFALGTLLAACSDSNDAANASVASTSTGAGTGGASTASSSTAATSTASSSAVTSGATGSTGGGTGTGGAGGQGGRDGGVGKDAQRDAATEGGATGLGPVGGACPGGTYPSPLPPNASATIVRSGIGQLEGPLWLASQNALFFCEYTDSVTSGRIHKYTPADGNLVTFADNVGVAGLALDPGGKIVAASHDLQRLTRFDPATGMRSDVPGGNLYMGQPFNQVNDVVVRSDGNMYFTDPDYQRKGRPGQDATAFYRLSPAGVVTRLGTGRQPNGIALSPDGNWLYVAGSDPARKLALAADGSVTGTATSFYSAGSDGMAVDCAGNVYMTMDGGILVVSSTGQNLGSITGVTDGFTTNSAFGGADRQTLYITTSTSLYQVHLNVPGFPN